MSVEIEVPIAAGLDDALETQAGISFDATGTTLSIRSGDHISDRDIVGLRFVPNIPVGSTIASACVSVIQADDAGIFDFDNPNLDIYCEDIDNSEDFGDNQTLVNRTRTTASTSWVATGIGQARTESPDFTDALQEVIDRPGYAGEAVTVLMVGKQGDNTATLAIESYETDPDLAARLIVEYTPTYFGEASGTFPALRLEGVARHGTPKSRSTRSLHFPSYKTRAPMRTFSRRIRFRR